MVSGFTGLIYESIWSHYLKLFLGHAAYAQSLVLAIFMSGMALGAWTVARYSARMRALLWTYVWVEGLIGVFGLAFHPAFIALSDYSFATVIPALRSPVTIHAYKWTLAALMILPQSVLLGMTFPLISGGLIRRWPARPGETLATLYFTNSLGGGIGVLLSGFVLIGAVGLPGTLRTAAVLNIALCLAIAAATRRHPEPVPPARPAGDSAPLARWFVIAAFLTGMASFMYELGWIRMLSLVLGSSTHSFELMLSAFIFGLAFGGLYVRRRIERIGDPVSYLARVMIVMGTLAALTLPAYQWTFDLMAWFLGRFAHSAGGYAEFNVLSQAIAALIMIPATFCAGITLPLLTHALLRRGGGERAIGVIYAANTLGAIAGVLLTIHVLMPVLGLKGVILGGAGIHLALGLSRLARRPWPARLPGFGMAACLAVYAATIFLVELDPVRMTSGVYRTGSAGLPPGSTVLYLRDGQTATISLVENAGTVTIATNGKPDAGVQMGGGEPSVDESTMLMAAAIPLSMLPYPARVANIGFGSGLTTHALLASDAVRRLDSIEIEPLMVEAARRGFGPRIQNVFEDPRSHVVFEDAKTFFASSREPYDLIVSEPSNPWVSGVATLFSDEFYGRIAQHLTADGYFAQWMQIYETNLDILASVIKGLAPHFGAYALYNIDDLDVLIVATRGATLRAPDDRLLQSTQLRAELARIGIQSVADFQSRKIGDNRTIGPVLQARAVPANSDFFPYVDLNAPRLRYMRENAMELPGLTVLPVPYLEIIGGAALTGTTLEPFAGSTLVRDRLVMRALAIRQALVSGNSDALDPVIARYLWLVSATPAACAGPQAESEWQNAVRHIADDTSAYLRPQELDVIWRSVISGACYRSMTGAGKDWVNLLAAIARRDDPQVVKLGTGLLGPPAENSVDDLAYLTTVTAAAYVRMGDDSQAHALLELEWGRLDHRGPFDFALRELLALTGSRGRPAMRKID